MLRTIIIISVVVVILAGGWFVINSFFMSSKDEGVPAQSPPPTPDMSSGLESAPLGTPIVAEDDPARDGDADGLPDAQEIFWGTDPANPDSDGDTYQDGREVANGYNPVIQSPNDKLAPGYTPPLQTSLESLDQAIDSVFQGNIDAAGGAENITQLYFNEVPAERRTPDTLTQFVERRPVVTQLPNIKDNTIRIQEQDSRVGMEAYLAKAENNSVLANQTALSIGMDELFRNNNPGIINALIRDTRLYQQTLLTLSVPPSAAYLHRLLLSYAQLLAATFEQIARGPEDQVRALVGVRQLEIIDTTYYPLIRSEIERLRSLTQALP